jgi:N-acetylmuramoyl-L-alanine amidase
MAVCPFRPGHDTEKRAEATHDSRDDSAMLRNVQKAARFAIFLLLAVAVAALARVGDGATWPGARGQHDQQQTSPPPQQPQQQQPVKPPTRTLTTVVLDPAHGGTDEGAHGSGGILEKDVTLALARIVRARLLRTGLNVVMTRHGDQTLSFADRAAIANAQPNAVFLTLHVGSSGAMGSAHAYYYDFGQVAETSKPSLAGGMLNWNLAQRPWENYSRRLAQLLQVEFSARLEGSPEMPSGAAVYQLRAINEPAVAVEIENVNAPKKAALMKLGAPLARSISRAIQSFRAVYQAEVH